ncbi:hypothetical protein V8C34DRAFT_199546 [Trichoderma compactum]
MYNSCFRLFFFVCFGLTLLDEVWRCMVTQLNGGRKQLVGRLTFGKIILGYSSVRRKKGRKKGYDVWFSHYVHLVFLTHSREINSCNGSCIAKLPCLHDATLCQCGGTSITT